MITPLIGIALLFAVAYVAFSERSSGAISFFDWHAAIVVLGGVFGSLCLAIDRVNLFRMLASLRDLLPSTSIFAYEMRENLSGLDEIRSAWRSGQRIRVLNFAETAETPELRLIADTLIKQQTGEVLKERFAELKSKYLREMQPSIEGWEIVGKLAPSFGMVGTVTGMVQLFRNMEDAGNLGGAMAMALLATLYGISFGAAVGGPMASRVNNQLNERINFIELVEQTVAALLEENPEPVGD